MYLPLNIAGDKILNSCMNRISTFNYSIKCKAGQKDMDLGFEALWALPHNKLVITVSDR